MKKVEILYRHLVENDVRNGFTCEDIVKKYPISMYYARKWSGEVFKNTDMNHLVRDRYKWLVGDCVNEIICDIGDSLDKSLVEKIGDSLWDELDFKIRQHLYDMSKAIVTKN